MKLEFLETFYVGSPNGFLNFPGTTRTHTHVKTGDDD